MRLDHLLSKEIERHKATDFQVDMTGGSRGELNTRPVAGQIIKDV